MEFLDFGEIFRGADRAITSVEYCDEDHIKANSIRLSICCYTVRHYYKLIVNNCFLKL